MPPTRDEMNSASGAFLSPLGLQGYHGSEKSASPATGPENDPGDDLRGHVTCQQLRRLRVLAAKDETIGWQQERIAALESELVDKATAIVRLEEHVARLGGTAREFEIIAGDRARVIADLRRVNGDLAGKLIAPPPDDPARFLGGLGITQSPGGVVEIERVDVSEIIDDIGLFLGVEDMSHTFDVRLSRCARCGRDAALIAESGPRICDGWGKDDITKPPPGYNDD